MHYLSTNGSFEKCDDLEGHTIVDISSNGTCAVILTSTDDVFLFSNNFFYNTAIIKYVDTAGIDVPITFVYISSLLFGEMCVFLVSDNIVYYKSYTNLQKCCKWEQIVMADPILNINITKGIMMIQTYT